MRKTSLSGYAKKFEFNLIMSFRISDKELLKKCNQIQKRIEKLLKIKLDRKPVYGDDEKYIKTKIKKYGDSAVTNFHSKKITKEKAPCMCLSIIILDSVIKAKKKYYPQTFLGECKYEPKNIKVEDITDEDLEKGLSDESVSESDNNSNDETESDNKKANDKSNE